MEFLVFDVNFDEWDWQRPPAPPAPDALETPLELVLSALMASSQPPPLLLLQWLLLLVQTVPPILTLSQTLSPQYRYTQSFTFSPSPKMALLALLLAPESTIDVAADSLPAPTLVHRHSEPVGATEATVDPKDLFGGTNMASLGLWGAPALATLAALFILERGRSQLLGLLPLDFSSFGFDLTALATVRDTVADVLPLGEVAEALMPDMVPVLTANDTLDDVLLPEMPLLPTMLMSLLALMPPLPLHAAPSQAPAPAPMAAPQAAPVATSPVDTVPDSLASAAAPAPPPRKRAKLEAMAPTSPSLANPEDIVYPCRECAKVFKRLEHLKRHVRLVHLDIRPFHCSYCEKKFSRLDNLAQHTKTHLRTDADGNTLVVYGNPNSRKRKLTSG